MKNENHRKEIKQIKDHVKILNITGGIAIGALAIAGYLMLSDPLKGKLRTKSISSSFF
ncbi:MAG: hypothetical protein IPP71_17010 [Bacteroidetes bacterium]|nr:hypothetical protein [Bacteroidota bacterium]